MVKASFSFHNIIPKNTQMTNVLFVLDLHMKYTVDLVPLCMYIVWFIIV